jgi:Zn-dependent protease with chaperone function
MDFFQNQDEARRRTWLLLFYFALAVLAMIVGLYAILFAVLGGVDQVTRTGGSGLWKPQLLLVSAAAVCGVVFLGMLYKTFELRGGGETLAVSLGGRRLNPDTIDLRERRLLNVVEEMALASGVPVPPVFVMDHEEGINAFAAGFTPGDAVIGVNRGTLEFLSRDELQGVIAHEFSHILNGDMRLNLRLIGLLHGILLLAIIGYYMARFGGSSNSSSRSRDSNKSGGGQIVLIGLGLFVLGYAGLFFARLIKAAVSRQREYLADASAVQFTRNPDGIGGALKKIGGVAGGSILTTAEAESASHMFFGNAIRGLWFPGFATHPPLVERIRRIDPQFDGTFPHVELQPLEASRPDKPVTARPSSVPVLPISLPGMPGAGAATGVTGVAGVAGAGRLALDPASFIASFGALDAAHVDYAHQLMKSLPKDLDDAVRDAFTARAIVLAMLLDDEADIRARQLVAIQQRLGAPTRQATEQLAPLVAARGSIGRLPLVELVQSTLRQLSIQQYRDFRDTVIELAQADRKVSVFEFTLQRSCLKRLDRYFFRTPPVKIEYLSLNGLLPELGLLLSAVAHVGAQDEQLKAAAFERGARTLGAGAGLELRPAAECSLRAIGAALDKLARSTPAIKKRLLTAALEVVSTDGQVTAGEAELLRALADSLECPLPPLFAGPIVEAEVINS